MSISKNQEVMEAANAAIGYATELIQLYQSVQIFMAKNNQRGYGNVWDDLPTYTANADGTVPETNDATPTVSHPIRGLNVSANDLTAIMGNLTTFKTNMETGSPTLINALLTRIV